MKRQHVDPRPSEPLKGRAFGSRPGKSSNVVCAMRRPNGATIAELLKITDWKANSVYGFISILRRDGRFQIEGFARQDGQHAYRLQDALADHKKK